uniref:Predicted protein n=1 Tax=Hordeum vulgare subsp. vulgare TaxID=112509 RepID=F2DSW2_HORVV|nr:predicted protein [Hordeum vulgare subsp. vulgare]
MVSGSQPAPCRSPTWTSASRCAGTVATTSSSTAGRASCTRRRARRGRASTPACSLVRNCQWSLDFMDGRHGARLAGLRAVGRRAHVHVQGQVVQRVGRPVGAGVHAAAQGQPVAGQGVPGEQLLLTGLLGGDRGAARRHRGTVRGDGAAGADGSAAAEAAHGELGARGVRAGQEGGAGGRGARGERRQRVEAAVRDALHGVSAMQRRPEPGLLRGQLRRPEPGLLRGQLRAPRRAR